VYAHGNAGRYSAIRTSTGGFIFSDGDRRADYDNQHDYHPAYYDDHRSDYDDQLDYHRNDYDDWLGAT
jgi:hypothetical protein